MKPSRYGVGRKSPGHGLDVSTRHWEGPGLQLRRIYTLVVFGPGDVERVCRKRVTNSLRGAGREIQPIPPSHHRLVSNSEGKAHAWREVVLVGPDEAPADT